MLKIMRSNKLKRFIAVLFILLSVFSMCFSVAAKAEAVTLSVGTIVVLVSMLAACGIKFSSSADASRAVQYVWDSLSDGLRSVVGGLVALCEGYQKARLQIPFSVFETFSNLFASLFTCAASSGGVQTIDFNVKSISSAENYGNLKASKTVIGAGSSLFYAAAGYAPITSVTYRYAWGTCTLSLFNVRNNYFETGGVQSYYDFPVVTTSVFFSDGWSFSYSSPLADSSSYIYNNFSKPFYTTSNGYQKDFSYGYSILGPCVSGDYFLPMTLRVDSVTVAGSTYGYEAVTAYDPYITADSSYFHESINDFPGSSPKTKAYSFTSSGVAVGAGLFQTAFAHYAASLAQNEDVLNYGVSRNPALSTNPDCTFPQTVDGSKDVYMDIPALKDTSLDDLITKDPADVATPADTKVENPTLVEGSDTNVGEGDVTVPSDASWLDKILAWLKALLDGILSIPGVISNGIAGVIEGIKAIPAAFAKWFESLIEGIKALGLSFVDWISQLKKMFVALFEPTVSLEDAFASLKSDFQAKIPYDRLSSSLTGFFDWLRGIGEKPPVFYITLYGNDYAIAPFEYLHAYRPYWIAFETFLMWAWFSLRVWKRIPSMIGGL